MPPQLVHGDGRIAGKICKIGMGKPRHMPGSPNSALVKVGSPQQHLSEVARSVVRRGGGIWEVGLAQGLALAVSLSYVEVQRGKAPQALR